MFKSLRDYKEERVDPAELGEARENLWQMRDELDQLMKRKYGRDVHKTTQTDET